MRPKPGGFMRRRVGVVALVLLVATSAAPGTPPDAFQGPFGTELQSDGTYVAHQVTCRPISYAGVGGVDVHTSQGGVKVNSDLVGGGMNGEAFTFHDLMHAVYPGLEYRTPVGGVGAGTCITITVTAVTPFTWGFYWPSGPIL